MANAPASIKRHALGLPPGSVRSLHVLLVVALFCIALLVPGHQVVPLPPYLLYLLFIILGHFFAAHGGTIAGPDAKGSPLHLPRGSLRLLIILVLAGCLGWKLYQDPVGLQAQYDASLDELKNQPLIPLLVLGGFFLGIVLRGLVGDDHALWFQDLKAWTSLVALVGLGIAVILHTFIIPSLETQVSMRFWEGLLGAIIAVYFGERS